MTPNPCKSPGFSAGFQRPVRIFEPAVAESGANPRPALVTVAAVVLLAMLTGCAHRKAPGSHHPRQGDEIMIAGELFHTGAPVVLWFDRGGYDAYRVDRRFVPLAQAGWGPTTQSSELRSPARYGMRTAALSPEELERVRGGGWDVPTLRKIVDQFVIHYDVAGTSRQCFKVLHDVRGLSVHFMIDLDGTIYQTLDVKERASHATIANDRSVGVEIANIGAYPPGTPDSPLSTWYRRDSKGRTRVVLPAWMKPDGIRTSNFVARPSRNEPVRREIQGQMLEMYDLTDAQYESLIKLTATLCRVLDRIECDYPRDHSGKLLSRKLDDAQLAGYRGVLGHFHVQANKIDPGPAFDWDRLIEGARRAMRR